MGLFHKFQLELVLYPKEHQMNGKKQIYLGLISFNKTNQKIWLILPLKSLPWLREQMTEILAKHDGTVEKGKETPIPNSATIFLH
jgi:hypothetical protein